MTRLLLTIMLTALSLLGPVLSAQELNCRVEVNTSQLEGTNKSVFDDAAGSHQRICQHHPLDKLPSSRRTRG